MVIFFYNPETPSNHFHVDLHIESWSFHSIHTADAPNISSLLWLGSYIQAAGGGKK